MALSYCSLYKALLYYCNKKFDSGFVISEVINCFEVAYFSIISLLQIRLLYFSVQMMRLL